MSIKHLAVGLGAVLTCLFGAPLLLIFLMAAGTPPVGANVGSAGDIPAVAMAVSTGASGRIGSLVTGCVVPAPVLLAVGKVESNHATAPVIGPALDVAPVGSGRQRRRRCGSPGIRGRGPDGRRDPLSAAGGPDRSAGPVGG